MDRNAFFCSTLGAISCFGAGIGGAQEPVPDARFAAPVLLNAGEARMGAHRYYPSPVLHDLDGDGVAELVIGDLTGLLTVARRIPGDGLRFGPEEPLLASDGERLDFHNW